MITLTLLASQFIWLAETIDLSDWTPSFGWCGRPLLVDDRLFIEDLDDGRIHAFATRDGLSSPTHLWATPSRGQGPGAIPKGAAINNMAVADDGALWVSHKRGITVYEPDGTHRLTRSVGSSYAWIFPLADGVIHTSAIPYRIRTIVSRSRFSETSSDWAIPYPHGIPTNNKGAFIDPATELYFYDGHAFVLEAPIGALMVVRADGEIVLEQHIPQTQIEALTLDGYTDSFRYGKDIFTVTRATHAHVGLAVLSDHIYLQAIHHCLAVRGASGTMIPSVPFDNPVDMRLLVKLDRSTGEILDRYAHPASAAPVYLFGAEDDRFLFFDQEEGNEISVVMWEDLVAVESLVF